MFPFGRVDGSWLKSRRNTKTRQGAEVSTEEAPARCMWLGCHGEFIQWNPEIITVLLKLWSIFTGCWLCKWCINLSVAYMKYHFSLWGWKHWRSFVFFWWKAVAFSSSTNCEWAKTWPLWKWWRFCLFSRSMLVNFWRMIWICVGWRRCSAKMGNGPP